MTRFSLSGIFIPLITPFLDEEIDQQSLEQLIEHYDSLPIAGYVVGGTTGEAHALSLDELLSLGMVVKSKTTKPVLLGISGLSTKDAVARVEILGAAPVDGFLLSLPPYIRPTQEGLAHHVSTVVARDSRPFVLYNIPYRNAVNLENSTVFELAKKNSNVVGIKDCCGSPSQAAELTLNRPLNFAVLAGDDISFFTALAHGAAGGILASALADPLSFHAVLSGFQQGDLTLARNAWKKLIPIISALFAEPNPGPLKYWLYKAGLIRDAALRRPYMETTENTRSQIDTLLLTVQR